ncbi:MAG: enoyl-CoA hydratase/isomerase family protein, partial [Pseudomonadales bacterium]
MSLSTLQSLLRSAAAAEALAVDAGASGSLVVDLESGTVDSTMPMAHPCCTVIGLRRQPSTPVPAVVDVIVGNDAELALIVDAVAANPNAACLLMQVLRHNEHAGVGAGLLVESLAYSSLQHGAEFARWLAGRKSRPARPEPRELVLLERDDGRLTITLNRPAKRNAYSANLRDALCEALRLPLEDPSIAEVVLRGAGPAFCAGGDLDEFGAA